MAAATYYVDPQVQSGGQGTQSDPWPDVATAFASGQIVGGDEILLAAGEYGSLLINGAHFDRPVTLRGPSGPAVAHFDTVRLIDSHYLTLERLAVWPRGPIEGLNIVVAEPNTSHIVLRDLDVRGAPDAADYPTWSFARWEATHYFAIYIRGADSVVENSRITGVGFGIQAFGPRGLVRGNQVRGFSGDGLRGVGDDILFEGNLVQDCVQINDNHADGFQAWSLGPDRTPGAGVMSGLVLRSNVIIEWASETRPEFSCMLQGIGMFTGMYEDTLIENNLILTNHWHGISIRGGLNTRIFNNTVLGLRGPDPQRPWIGLFPHVDGRPSAGAVIANNIASLLVFEDVDMAGIQQSQNLTGGYPARILTAPYAGDFSPLPGGPAIDAADPLYAPDFDVYGTPRGTPDIGAVEAR